MLLYGTIQNLQITDKTKVYNFSSLNEWYTKLNLLPPREFGWEYDYTFDMRYAEYIMCNDIVFFDLMMIVFSLYQGEDIFILIDDNPMLEPMNDSLFKFIQQRYGYNSYRINSLTDFLYSDDSNFTEFGLQNLDLDKDRLSYMIERERILNGGKPYSEDGE